MLYSRPLLVICFIYSSVHMLIPNFSFIPPLSFPLWCKKIKPVNPKGNQFWIFIGRTDAEVETLILWPPDAKNWLIGKDLNAGKDWRQKEKGMTEDEMVGWHHRFNGHEFEQIPGVGNAQGSLVCYSPWGCKELDATEQLNWTELNHKPVFYVCEFVSVQLGFETRQTRAWTQLTH